MKITAADARSAQESRNQDKLFPKAKQIENGNESIDGYIDFMREFILNKNGIVDAATKEEFDQLVNSKMNGKATALPSKTAGIPAGSPTKARGAAAMVADLLRTIAVDESNVSCLFYSNPKLNQS